MIDHICDSNCNCLYAWVRVSHCGVYKDDQWLGFLTSQITNALKFLVPFVKYLPMNTSGIWNCHRYSSHIDFNITLWTIVNQYLLGTLWLCDQLAVWTCGKCTHLSGKTSSTVERKDSDVYKIICWTKLTWHIKCLWHLAGTKITETQINHSTLLSGGL